MLFLNCVTGYIQSVTNQCYKLFNQQDLAFSLMVCVQGFFMS